MKIKSTKRALLMSALSLLMCISMLIGSTFAWFTDSVTSGNNVIMSGNLDVVLEYKTNWSDEWAPVDENTKIFKEGALYEPGYTEVVFLRVSNAGSLALKYLLSLNIGEETKSTNVYGEEFRISDYLEVGTYFQDEYSSGFNYADILMPVMFGSRESALSNVELNTLKNADSIIRKEAPLLPGEDTAQVVAIVLTMSENVGNEANAAPDATAPSIELGVSLIATQYTHENDSFGNQYDADASIETVHDIIDLETLMKAFSEGGTGRITNMHITGLNNTELGDGKTLNLNMNTSTLEKADNADYAIVNYGDLSITGEGTIVSNMKGSIENYGKLYINNLTIDVIGSKYGFHVKGGEVEINNLTLTAQRGGLNCQAGTVTFNSGSVTTTAYSTNIGYLVYAGGTSEVIINGGDFDYEGTYYRHGVLYAGNDASIVVNGGTFGKGGTNTAKKPWLQTAQNGTITLQGGSFEFDPTVYINGTSIVLADGYEVVKGDDGLWTVSQIAG